MELLLLAPVLIPVLFVGGTMALVRGGRSPVLLMLGAGLLLLAVAVVAAILQEVQQSVPW